MRDGTPCDAPSTANSHPINRLHGGHRRFRVTESARCRCRCVPGTIGFRALDRLSLLVTPLLVVLTFFVAYQSLEHAAWSSI